MICSSVNRLFRISPPIEEYHYAGSTFGEQVTAPVALERGRRSPCPARPLDHTTRLAK